IGALVLGDGIHVGQTNQGSVTVANNTIGGTRLVSGLVIGGDGIDVRDAHVFSVITDNRIAAGNNVGIGGNGILSDESRGAIVTGNTIASGANSTIGANGIS